jgi:hypothetical protein
MSDSKRVQSGGMVAFVRSQTFKPRADLDLLFVAVDIDRGVVMKAWLVPSQDFAELVTTVNRRGRMRFGASMKPTAKDRWVKYRLGAEELAPQILARLAQLDE